MPVKALFIGGTGILSAAISRRALELGWELWLLNRGNRSVEFGEGPGILRQIHCDISDEADVAEKLAAAQELATAEKLATAQELAAAEKLVAAQELAGAYFDVVADFIAFVPSQIERDYRLFKGKTAQYIFISSASAYQKPLSNYRITEGTPLANPYWEYSRQKIACEELLMKLYREEGFPVTIVRPSHTYDERSVPLGVHGKNGSWQVIKRILDGKPVIIHGDGTSLWTMTSAADFARAFTGLAGNIRALGEAVQITSGETLSWNQIYQAIADALGKPLKAVHVSSEFLAQAGPDYDFTGSLTGDKAVSVVFDNTKLKRLVPDFCPQVRFDQGIRKTIDYVLSHPELQKEDPEFDTFCDRLLAAREKALAEM